MSDAGPHNWRERASKSVIAACDARRAGRGHEEHFDRATGRGSWLCIADYDPSMYVTCDHLKRARAVVDAETRAILESEQAQKKARA